MRYILSLALLFTACTRANPDLIGGHGGSGGGGTAGSGGGGGAAGSGGNGGGVDLAMSLPEDMAHGGPDMTSFDGVACGAMSCKGNEPDCCVNNTGSHCVSGSSTGGCVNGPLITCDGPEDCTGPFAGEVCCLQFSSSGQGGNKLAGTGCLLPQDCAADLPLCHTVSDCPASDGYVGCCAVMNTTYHHCSKTPCA